MPLWVYQEVYVDDINLTEAPMELENTVAHPKSEFKMKDFVKTRYCLGLQIEHCSNSILVQQSNQTTKMLRCFNEDKVLPSSTPTVVRTLDAQQGSFCPNEDDEVVL